MGGAPHGWSVHEVERSRLSKERAGFSMIMAAKREANWFCDTCSIQFKYKSKYLRHLERGTHKRFLQSMSMSAADEVDSEILDDHACFESVSVDEASFIDFSEEHGCFDMEVNKM